MALTPGLDMEIQKGGGLILPETELKPVLMDLGFSVPRGVVLSSMDNLDSVRTLNFPVVVKYISCYDAHKARKGMVALDICSVEKAIDIAAKMVNQFGRSRILIEEQIGHGLDLFFGFIRDDTFGPLSIINLGGTMAEHSEYAIFLPIPFKKDRAVVLLRRSKLWSILKNHGDYRTLIELLWRSAEIFLKHESWVAMDLNPVRIVADKIYVLDAKAYLKNRR